MANPNRVANPGFEDAGGGGDDVYLSWTEVKSDGAVADEQAIVHDISVHSCKLTAGAGKDTCIHQQITIVPGTKYLLRLWTYGDATTPLRIGVYNAAQGAVLTNDGILYEAPIAEDWAEAILPFTNNDVDTHCHLIVWCPDLNGGLGYVDDMSIYQIPAFWHQGGR